MTEAESTPIVINSEEEDEDDDDIVVLKEEKVPIPADDDDDDDDAVIFIASTSITKTKDNTVLGPKTEPSSSKDLTRSLSLTSSFDVSLNLTGPLDLSKHTERDGDNVVDPTTAAATSVKLSDKETLVDLEETDSQQSLTDDLLDSVGGSSLDNSFVGPGSPSVDSNSSSNSSVSLPATPPLKWSPQPSTSGVKTNSGVGGPPDLIVPQGKAGSPCIDDLNFLELLRKYDYPSSQSTDNQSCMSIGAPPSPSISVTSQPVGAVPTHIHPNSCDTTLSSSPTSLSANSKQLPCIGTSSMISPTSKSLLRSGTTTCHTYSSSQDTLPKTSSSANTVCQFTDLVHTTLSLNTTPSPASPVSKVTVLPKPTCVSTVQSSAGPSTSRTDLSSNSGLASDATTGSNLNSDSSLGSNSVLPCGTGIRSGNSQSWTTGTSRLSQLSLPPRKRVRPDTVMLTPTSSASSSKSDDACVNCKSILHDLKVSRCTQGHPACSTCLEDQVKLILTDKQGSLKCIMVSCGSYYPMSELKYTLPSMVVEILEDKLHKEHINFVCDMLLPDTGADDQSGTAVAAAKSGKTGTKADEASAGKKQKFDEDVLSLFEPLKEVQSSPDEDEKLKSPEEDKPQKWDPMDKMVNLAIMALEPESDEYVEVAVNFYSTLAFPSADIVKISRVQNPILWKYYQLKRTEMIHENDGHQVDERQLFHGTNSSVIEAICKKGFDWRVCGKHGSVYGQGSYFAKAASYSHQYTEKVSGHRSRMMAIRTLSALTSSSRTSSSSAVFRQPPGSVLIGPFNQMQVNQLIPHNFLPPPAHMPLGSSLISGIHGQLTPPSTAAPPPPQPQSSSRSNLTVISNIFSGPMPTNSSTPVINSNQNMPVESNHPSAGMARGFPPSNSGRCSAFNTSNNNTTFPQQANFLRQGSEPSPLRQNNSQKSTKDAKVRVVPMADITSSQTRKMFLAKVLVGKYTGGNTGHRRPPPFYPAEPYGKCYDSCVDNIWDPKIFVIFDSNQAYPEYIVEYNVMNE